MKLFETRTAPNPRRVRMFLAEKGLLDQIELIQIDLQKGENLSPEFAARNPMKKVPVLELDDGSCIAETMAICRYFEELHPEPPLLGTSARERAHIEQWLRWLDYYFMMPTGMCFQHTSGYFKDRMNPIREWGEDCRRNVSDFLQFLDDQLADRTYICGENFTAADINAFATLEFNRVNNIRIQPEQQKLQAWYECIKERSSARV